MKILKNGSKTVPTGSSEPLEVSPGTKGLYVFVLNPPTNAGTIRVGAQADVDAGAGIPLGPGASYKFEALLDPAGGYETSQIFVKGTVAEAIDFMAEGRA